MRVASAVLQKSLPVSCASLKRHGHRSIGQSSISFCFACRNDPGGQALALPQGICSVGIIDAHHPSCIAQHYCGDRHRLGHMLCHCSGESHAVMLALISLRRKRKFPCPLSNWAKSLHSKLIFGRYLLQIFGWVIT